MCEPVSRSACVYFPAIVIGMHEQVVFCVLVSVSFVGSGSSKKSRGFSNSGLWFKVASGVGLSKAPGATSISFPH